MDNITHTVIGLVAGDFVHQSTNKHEMQSVERRRLFLLSSVLGNNVPDLDVFLRRFYDQPVGALLHHRGYSHTFVWAIPEALGVVAFLFLLRGGLLSKRLSTRDWVLALFTAFLGVGLHLFADGWNSYGIHPFYPWDNSWHYGDYIFIVEPFIWALSGAWIILELPLPWRLLYFASFGLLIGFGFSVDAVSLPQVLFLIALVSTVTLVMGFLSSSRRSGIAILCLASVLGTFHYYSGKAREFVTRAYGNAQIEDIALSPLPMSPYCWFALAATIEGDEFVIRRANVSLWPERIQAKSCRFFERDTNRVTRFVSDASVDWNREYRTKLGLFASYSSDCYFKDWMKFARMPMIENGVATDVRFANRGGRNFTDMVLKPGRHCMEDSPPWIAPRRNLMMESK